jgi:hypothetical protein
MARDEQLLKNCFARGKKSYSKTSQSEAFARLAHHQRARRAATQITSKKVIETSLDPPSCNRTERLSPPDEGFTASSTPAEKT